MLEHSYTWNQVLVQILLIFQQLNEMSHISWNVNVLNSLPLDFALSHINIFHIFQNSLFKINVRII
jgi:hypothetical protein